MSRNKTMLPVGRNKQIDNLQIDQAKVIAKAKLHLNLRNFRDETLKARVREYLKANKITPSEALVI